MGGVSRQQWELNKSLDRVSCNPGWPQSVEVVEDEFVVILQPLSLQVTAITIMYHYAQFWGCLTLTLGQWFSTCGP